MRTVAAVSTPRGKGGVALIRISGDSALAVADRCFRARSGKSIADYPPRSAVYGTVYSDTAQVQNGGDIISEALTGTPVDNAVAVYFAAPKSYTGEDTVELTCHGGVAVTAAVLEAVLAAGAYAAGAGEFTRRAYFNGRLSLTEAEAVGRLIDADTDARRALAYTNLSGRLAKSVAFVSEKLTGTLAKLYASIDYPDEDLDEFDISELTAVFSDARRDILSLCRTYKTGRAISDGVRTVIVGKPNAGKSSLFNRLTRTERSIVTNVPGTTRDYIEAVATVGGVTLNLFDTAGIRDTSDVTDEIEKLGIDRSRKQLAGAELVIFLADAESGITAEDTEILTELKSSGAAVIAAVNKADAADAKAVAKSLADFDISEAIPLSVSSGDGIDALEAAVADIFTRGVDVKNDAVVTEARQAASLSRAASFLSDAIDSLGSGYAPDIAGVSVENAIAELDLTDGKNIGEDIVEEIFSRFCVGK